MVGKTGGKYTVEKERLYVYKGEMCFPEGKYECSKQQVAGYKRHEAVQM